ncbi:MAG: DUF1080 domain-containing protein, partial [Limisphaerales bacterium]
TCVSLVGCATSQKSANHTSKERPWIVLFDGTSTDALRGYKREGFPDKGWAVQDGTLKTVPNVGRVDLISRERFKDFEWEFEWKVSPGGNSGVFYGVQESDGPAYSTGPEYQLLDDSKHRDGGNKLTSAGALYALIPPNSTKRLNPVGEFNSSRIVAKDGHIEHWLNGAKVLEYNWNSPELRKLVAGSKFKTMPRFMENLEGHVALQHHGEEVWFRNIRIRRL